MRIPSATYRLQFHTGFTLSDAAELVDYLDELGITDVYASPLLASRSGSPHGYDVVDPMHIDPELGGDASFEKLASALRARSMGLLLDIVPNHMAASHENAWWWDVLEHGRDSAYAGVFDIDWGAGRVLLPVLGARYGEVLESGALEVVVDGDRLELHYHEHRFPLRRDSYEHVPGALDERARRLNGRPGRPESFDALHELLEAQHYRLAFWRRSGREASYRRFFDITDLVSVRAEDPEVFRLTHERILELVREGAVTGLRIDHVDGLHDPAGYLERLRQSTTGIYVVIEKILDRGEDLAPDWATAGTTGYEFANTLGGIFVDPRGARRLTEIGDRFTGSDESFSDVVYAKKRLVLDRLFGGEVRALGNRLAELAEADRHGRDLGAEELTEAVRAVTATLDVYRTYVSDHEISRVDRGRIEHAVEAARARAPGSADAIGFLRSVLLLERADEDRLAFVRRWQQLTGPAMAKGFEDTALYAYVRLASRNEVGGDPGTPAVPTDEFHRLNALRLQRWPGALNTTSTHDTKRSEDVRARIDVLSEIPDLWEEHLDRWRRRHGPGPDRSEELLLYQTLVGIWPTDGRGMRPLTKRVQDYMVKAAREAKVNTSWRDPDERHERALRRFASRIMADERFRRELDRFHRPVAFHGAVNALSQVVAKIASPGVPDLYQGTELWHLFLVDPDNRRPVDFALRRRLLSALADADPAELWSSWPNGRVKLFVTHRALCERKRDPDLYLRGEYIPLEAAGPKAGHVCAFARHRDSSWSLAVVPRLTTRVGGLGEPPLGRTAWGTTRLPLGAEAPARWTDVLTSRTLTAARGSLRLAEILDDFPVAMLRGEGRAQRHNR